MIEAWQAEERHEKPGDEEEIADRGDALAPPVHRTMPGRTETADAADSRSAAHYSAPFFATVARIGAQISNVTSTEAAMVSTAPVLLTLSS